MTAAMGAVGIGSSVAGGILSAVGAKRTGEANQRMYDYQAQVAKINSQIDLQNADFARNQGEIQAQQFGIRSSQQAGAIKVGQAASGIDVNSGSALDVQKSQRLVSNIDMAQIRSNAAKTAYDFTTKSTMDLNQANLLTTAGQNARTAGNISAMSSILGSVGSVSSKWLQGSQVGLIGSGSGPSSGVTLYGPNQNVTGYIA